MFHFSLLLVGINRDQTQLSFIFSEFENLFSQWFLSGSRDWVNLSFERPLLVVSDVFSRRQKEESLVAQTGDPGLVPGSTRSPGEGIGYPLQRPCLENPMDRGAWRATVHGVTRVGHGWTTNTQEEESASGTAESWGWNTCPSAATLPVVQVGSTNVEIYMP